MNFDSNIQNKTTEFICKHGDKECHVVFNYDTEVIEEVVSAFETILQFLTYSNPSQTMKDYYNQE